MEAASPVTPPFFTPALSVSFSGLRSGYHARASIKGYILPSIHYYTLLSYHNRWLQAQAPRCSMWCRSDCKTTVNGIGMFASTAFILILVVCSSLLVMLYRIYAHLNEMLNEDGWLDDLYDSAKGNLVSCYNFIFAQIIISQRNLARRPRQWNNCLPSSGRPLQELSHQK